MRKNGFGKLLVVWMNINFDNRSKYFAIILDILVPISNANKKFMRFMIVNTMRSCDHMLVRHQSSSAKSVKVASISMFNAKVM